MADDGKVDIPLVREMKKQGGHNPRDWAKKFSRPGMGTVERYMNDDQDPITTTGNWRAAPVRMANMLNVDIAVLFPEAADRRQQILDDLSNDDSNGVNMTLLHCVRCPRTAEDGGNTLFVLVDLTCASCRYKSELTGSKLICTHKSAPTV